MGVEIEQYYADVRRLDVPGFRGRYGEAFLVRSSLDGPVEMIVPEDTRTLPGAVNAATELVLPSLKRELAADEPTYFVHPVMSRLGAEGISVGREESADISIPDRSISRLHAEFRRMPDGHFQLVDRDSKNGTFLARRQLDPNQPAIVRSGQVVQFGNVVATFLQTKEFVDFVYDLIASR